jgi:hypothetical protein
MPAAKVESAALRLLLQLVAAAHAAKWMAPVMTEAAIAALAQALHSAHDEVRPRFACTAVSLRAGASRLGRWRADCAERQCCAAALPAKRCKPIRRTAAGRSAEPRRHPGVAVRIACKHVCAAVVRERAVGAPSAAR